MTEKQTQLLDNLRSAWSYEITNYYGFTAEQTQKAYRNRVNAVRRCRVAGIGNNDIDDVMYDVSDSVERDIKFY